ncbi:hypothetical protein ACA910_006700 [Epithemia clementina (nom. ined.)]
MAKSVLLDVLEKTIGKYVLNLDASSLNVAIWSGKIELNSLQLDTKAVNFELSNIKPPIPFRVKSGHFVHLQVDVPWAHLMSKPVVAHAKGLHVKIAPHNNNNKDEYYDNEPTPTPSPTKDEKPKGKGDSPVKGSSDNNKNAAASKTDGSSNHALLDPISDARIRAIENAEEYRQQANALRDLAQEDLVVQDDSNDNNNTNKKSSASFGAKLVRRIVENLQVEISDVHIILESSDSSAGVLLKSLNFETTDKDGNRTYVDRLASKDSFLYKRLQIRGLGLYLDDEEELSTLKKKGGKNSHLTAIQEQTDDDENNDENDDDDAGVLDHAYVLAPLSFEAKLRQADSNVCIEHPKYLLQSGLNSLSILMSKTQVQLAHKIGLMLHNSNDQGEALVPLFPEYRPALRLCKGHGKEAAKQWWQYALRCVGRLNGQRLWVEFYRAFRKRKQYIPLYKRKMFHCHRDAELQREREKNGNLNKNNTSSKNSKNGTTPSVGCHWLRPLNAQEQAQLHELEMDRSISTQGLMMWRNIAEAQVQKEREKYDDKERKKASNKTSLFTSLFGSKAKTDSEKEPKGQEEDEDPPIVLSSRELKELEDVALMEQREQDDALSNESKMFDIQFVLGSFQINLTTYNFTSLALLKMGTVSTKFQSNANGAFDFDFSLSSLSIEDKITTNTFFPTVLKNQSKSNNNNNNEISKAFSIRMNKTKSGDQQVQVQLSTFEAIASPNLVKEMKRFFSVTDGLLTSGGSNYNAKANPILAQSLSGSVDLFYDASEGPQHEHSTRALVSSGSEPLHRSTLLRSPKQHNARPTTSNNTKVVSDNISNALFDAWKARTETRSSWLIDLDLQAPIIVLPESSTKATANVLVFDLGHLTLAHGSAVSTPSTKVKQWFKANPKIATKTEREPILDHGNLQVSSLSFLIGRVNDWRKFVKKHENSLLDDSSHDNAIVEPITLGMEFGVEASSSENVPRVCAFAVLPSISFAVSPEQLARILGVYQSWKTLMSPQSGSLEHLGSIDSGMNQSSILDDNASMSSAGSRMLERAHKLTMNTIMAENPRDASGSPTNKFKQVHVDLQLQRFSVKVSTDDAMEGMETHLVSVGSAITLLSNGVSDIQLKMGWFWVLDNFHNDFARTQRLVAHSSLPASASELALGAKYNIMSKLDEIGVFEPTFGGSSDLADVSVVYSPGSLQGKLDPFVEDSLSSSADSIATNALVDAKFSSLFVNWNPRAITQVLEGLKRFTNFLGENVQHERQSTVILMTPEDAIHVGHVDELETKLEEANDQKQPSCVVVRARMESVNLCLRSARDDLPIFTLTMSSANASLVTKGSDDMIMRASLGNISITTPNLGRTNSKYRTLLGISPGKSDSLLSVLYAKGKAGMSSVNDSTLDNASDLGAWALVTISPMRMVHIQSQVLSLIEYATAGILGTLTQQAASSAAMAAKEMAISDSEKKLFVVRATGFEVLLPEKAYDEHYCTVKTGAFTAEYTVLPEEKGGEAKVSISGVMIADRKGVEMLDDPIQVGMDVTLPPEGVGTPDDQAMRVKINMSSAPFLLLKSQYKQIMSTLENNIAETDLYLRDTDSGVESQKVTGEPTQNSLGLTHAGVAAVQIPRSMYVDLIINSLSLDLMGQDANDSIVSVKADKAVVGLVSRPNEGRLWAKISLRDLVCLDERAEALGRSERALISQDNADDPDQQFFDVSYEKTENGKTEIGLKVGSPRIVLVPDAVSELLGFIAVDKSDSTMQRKLSNDESRDKTTEFHVTSTEQGDAFEVEARSVPAVSKDEQTSSFALNTNVCSIVLVDLGGDSLADQVGSRSAMRTTSVAETIVLRGAFDAKGSVKTNMATSAIKSAATELHGDGVEIYTALGANSSAIQVLDPFSFSIYGHARGMDTSSRTFDLRVAVLSPIDMCVSMRNFALLNAILESIRASREGMSPEKPDQDLVLSSQDANLIEHLDHALEADDSDQKSVRSMSSEAISVSHFDSGIQDQVDTTESKSSMNVTLPEAKITIVNDLQGLDDALIRFDFHNVVTNMQVREGARITPSTDPYTGFDAHLNCSIGADYFDNSEGLWKDFFLKPWELTIRAGRGPNLRLKTNRPSTYLDIESFPCHISFSEEFLFSLASANQMWTVYSMATSSLVQSADVAETGVKLLSPSGQKLSAQDRKHSTIARSSGVRQSDLRHGIPGRDKNSSLKRSMAATAARTLVTALPYAVENNSGFDINFKILELDSKLRTCANGSIEYFRFPPPKSKGTGGKRLYGQDVTFKKQVSIRIMNTWFEINHVDDEMGQRHVHTLQNSHVVFTQILKEGKTTVVHVSSGVNIHGKTSIPIEVRMPCTGGGDGVEYVGVCGYGRLPNAKLSIFQNGKYTRQSAKLGLPVDRVRSRREEWRKKGSLTCFFSIVPNIPLSNNDDFELRGDIQFMLDRNSFRGSEQQQIIQTEAVCRPMSLQEEGAIVGGADSFVVQVRVVGRMVDQQHPCLDIFLEPRALIENKLPIPIGIRTPMPQTYSTEYSSDSKGTTHELDPDKAMEIYTLSQSIAISVKCSDNPVGGTPTGWMEGNWVDLPLKQEYRLPGPQRCTFPFTSYSGTDYNIPGGSQFLIADGVAALSDLSGTDKNKEPRPIAAVSNEDIVRTFFVTVCNYSVDHTGEILFGLVENSPHNPRRHPVRQSARRNSESTTADCTTPVGAYRSSRHHGRVSLLPESHEKVQLIHLTMEGEVGMRKSQPFYIEGVSICDGGVNSTPILWEDGNPSGFFAYQRLVNTYQSELHVIPEFIVFNGSKKFNVRVRQRNGADVIIEPGKISPLRRSSQEGAIISVSWLDFQGATAPLSVDRLGLRVAIVRTPSGLAIGSIAIQTVVGSNDSRLVVKLADIRLGSEARNALTSNKAESMLDNDFLRFRVQWSELKVTLNEAKPIVGKKHAYLESALDMIATQQGADPTSRYKAGHTSQVGQTWTEARNLRNQSGEFGGEKGADAVCTLVLQQFTVDWQRVFKEDPKPSALRTDRERLQSQERSQLSIIIHKIRITDDTPRSVAPVVLDCTSDNASFFDLCIRVKGPLDAELVNVDLFDLNLAFAKGNAERIVLSTSESFAWKLLDLGDQILAAAGEISGFALNLEWDEDHGGYKVQLKDSSSYLEEGSRYTPPNSEKLFDIRVARVSPFVVLLSFDRTPVQSKYSPVKTGRNAALMNYFTQRLQFKIERAELKFAKYEAAHIKGPADRVMEVISTVYMSRMKLQFVTLMTAMSLQDWKFLAARACGDDEFQDGDLVRAAGNLAGNTVNYVLKGTGRGIESVFKRGSSNLGAGIESVASKVGARAFGSSVNSVVSGVGGGMGEAVSGVGSGAGHLVKGVGRGVGQVVGGVTGGASMMVKGTAKGIASGDGRAVASSVVEGARSVGSGVGQGVSSVVAGTADGVYSVGKGLFSGVRSVGKDKSSQPHRKSDE